MNRVSETQVTTRNAQLVGTSTTFLSDHPVHRNTDGHARGTQLYFVPPPPQQPRIVAGHEEILVSDFSQYTLYDDRCGTFYDEVWCSPVYRALESASVPIIDVSFEVSPLFPDGTLARGIAEHVYPLYTRMLADFAPSAAIRIENFLYYIRLCLACSRQKAQRLARSLYLAAHDTNIARIIVSEDVACTPIEIISDVLNNPVREIKAFLQSVACTADNAFAIIDQSKVDLIDPLTNRKSTPMKILAKATYNFISSLAHRPASDVAGIFSIVLGLAASKSSYMALGSTLLSSLALILNPQTSTAFTARKAALYNLSRMISVRQVTRFLLLAAILLLAWKVGGKIYQNLMKLFRASPIVQHSASGPTTVITVLLGLLITWLTGHYKSSFVVDFLRTSSLIGGTNFVFNSLNDAVVFVTRLIADFATWVGLKKVSQPLMDFVSKKSLEAYTRRGGELSELLPVANAFLAARSMGYTGPGTYHYVEEGRMLLKRIDKMISEVTAIDGAGHILNTLSRLHLNIQAAIESSLFASENSSDRVEPVFAIFCGGPRMGKTMFVNSFISALRLHYANQDHSDGHVRQTAILARENRWVYSRNTADPFFSGYNKQAVIFYDDLFTANAAPENTPAGQRHELELGEIQGLASSQPYAPSFPEVGSGVPCPKGTFINPAFVVATSNFMLINANARCPSVIDDRIGLMILVTCDPDKQKDSDFSHLKFHKLVTSVSKFRDLCDSRGVWQHPYGVDKQFPTTHREFDDWKMKDMFVEVTPLDLIDSFTLMHEERLLELHIRKQAAHKLSLAASHDYIDELEQSYVDVCSYYDLVPIASFRERLLAIGFDRTLSLTQTRDGARLRYAPGGPISFFLHGGTLKHNLVGYASKNCECPGGHTCIVTCPHFQDLVLRLDFVIDRQASPIRPLPPLIVFGGEVVRTTTPFPPEETVAETVIKCLQPYDCVHHISFTADYLGRIPEGYRGLCLVPGALGVIRAICVCQSDARELSGVTRDGDIVRVGRHDCYEPTVVTKHHNVRENLVERLLRKQLDLQPEEPTEQDIDEVVQACGTLWFSGQLSFDPKLISKLQRNIEAAYDDSGLVPEPTLDTFWVHTAREMIEQAKLRTSTRVLPLDIALESEIYLKLAIGSPTFAKFFWRYLTVLFLQAYRNRLEMDCPLALSFVSTLEEPGVKCVQVWHQAQEPKLLMEFKSNREAVTMADLQAGLRRNNFTQHEINGYLREYSSLLSFLNAYLDLSPPVPWLERLTTALQSIWTIISTNAKVILTSLAAVAGAIGVTSLMVYLGPLFTRKHRDEVQPHSSLYHRPSPHVMSAWPVKYHQFLTLCEHPNSARREDGRGRTFCPLCSNFSNVSHSNFDSNKELAIVRELIRQNKRRPELKNYLRGMLEFNDLSMRVLTCDDEETTRRLLLRAAIEKKVPFTGSGMTRHLYIYRAWNCLAAREKARAAIKEQSLEIVKYLGNFRGDPLYNAPLDFVRSCEIRSEPIPCCRTIADCVHVEEHAYYLPDSTIQVTGVDQAVATAASGMGFILANGHVIGRGVILGEGALLTPKHVVQSYLGTEDELEWRGQTRFKFFCPLTAVVLIDDADVAVIKVKSDELPASLAEGLWKEESPKVKSKVSLIQLSTDISKTPIATTVLDKTVASLSNLNHFLVDKKLTNGDSGSLVIQGGKIVGHYYGAVGDCGIVARWPTSVLKAVKQVRRSDFFDSRFTLYVDEAHGFTVIDEYDTKVADSSPPTAERKTELYNAFQEIGVPCVKFPASQSKEALFKSTAKWEPVTEDFSGDYLMAANDLHSHLGTLIELEHGVLEPFETWDDAVNGGVLGKNRVLKKVDTATSAGAPWCDMGINKRWFLDDTLPDRVKCKPNFVELMDTVEAKFQSGDVAGFTATANNKDELRDLERVRDKKTRLFCATPMHHNVMFRKYYGRWIGAYKALNFKQGMHAMGSDVFGTDWNDLYDYLMSAPAPSDQRDPVFLAGDFSRFDTSHSGWKLNLAFKVAAACNADQRMSEILARSISRFALRFNDREFKVPAGLPSGCQMTTPINCILNTLIWLTVWRKLTGGNLAHFQEHCRLIVYGDDVVLGIDRQSSYFKYLDPRRIQEIVKSLGYILESNDDKELRWQKIDEVTFLKRRFVLDHDQPGVVHAPRPLDEVFTQLMWRRSEPTLEGQQCCFYAFAAELGQYSPYEQRTAKSKLIEAIRLSKSDLMRDAFCSINFDGMMKRAHTKQLALEDIQRLNTAYWRLW